MAASVAPRAEPNGQKANAHDDGSAAEAQKPSFEVRLANFTGPFDLLLALIAKHQLDITEVAIATVTDEFIKYIKRLQKLGEEWALDEASEFLVIAATLLDLKAARLLPAGDVEDHEDIALLEARDLLFARLLQYKAFKRVAALIGATLAEERRRFPRQVALEEQFAAMLPELVWKHTPKQFAAVAERALKPVHTAPMAVDLAHLHSSPVSVKEQAELMGLRLRLGGPLSFRVLITDADSPMVVVARFLALLEMFRDKAVAFDQLTPLGDLTVHWISKNDGWTSDDVSEEYEEQ